jgi:hypothetical protein
VLDILFYFMGCPGFEPGTNRLKAEYSTVELATHLSDDRKLLYAFRTFVFYALG